MSNDEALFLKKIDIESQVPIGLNPDCDSDFSILSLVAPKDHVFNSAFSFQVVDASSTIFPQIAPGKEKITEIRKFPSWRPYLPREDFSLQPLVFFFWRGTEAGDKVPLLRVWIPSNFSPAIRAVLNDPTLSLVDWAKREVVSAMLHDMEAFDEKLLETASVSLSQAEARAWIALKNM